MWLDVVFLAGFIAATLGFGACLLGRLSVRPESPWDRVALGSALGLGSLATALLGLGMLGLLTRSAILLTMTSMAAVGIASFVKRRDALRVGPALVEVGARPRFVSLLAGVVLISTFLASLAPVTDGDALCYHLQVPKVFLEHSAFVYEPDLHETVYPLIAESLYAAGLALRGPVACRLISWWLGVVFAMSVTAAARPWLGSRASLAGLVAVAVPAVSNGMRAPLNDVALAAFGNAAIASWVHWRTSPSSKGLALTAILAGFAIGVKFPALVLAALLAAATTLEPSRSSLRARSARLFAFAAIVTAAGGWWYLRAYIYTGNPVHPFFKDVFGGAGLDEVLDPEWRPLAVNPGNLLAALVPLTLDPARFDSVAHQLGPVFLMFLPALIFLRTPRGLLGLVALGYGFLMICMTQRQGTRFILTAVGPLAAGVAWVISNYLDRKSVASRFILATFLFGIAFESAIAIARTRHGAGVLLDRESVEAYLDRIEPTYRVGRWIEARLPGNRRLIGQDHRGFYIPGDYAMELAHRRRTGLGARGESAEEIAAALRREGFTHLLMCPPDPIDAVEFDPTLGRLLAPWLRERSPLYRERLSDGDGTARLYEIYDLAAVPRSLLLAR